VRLADCFKMPVYIQSITFSVMVWCNLWTDPQYQYRKNVCVTTLSLSPRVVTLTNCEVFSTQLLCEFMDCWEVNEVEKQEEKKSYSFCGSRWMSFFGLGRKKTFPPFGTFSFRHFSFSHRILIYCERWWVQGVEH
jgi:hypothetical protein